MTRKCPPPATSRPRDLAGQEFVRDEAVQVGVLGVIEDAHPLATELRTDTADEDGLVDGNHETTNSFV